MSLPVLPPPTSRTSSTSQSGARHPIEAESEVEVRPEAPTSSAEPPLAPTGHERSQVQGIANRGVELPRAVGEVSAPALQFDPHSFMQRMEHGVLTVAVPMVGGARIGDVSVRPDTRAAVNLAITNGRLDLQRTQINFENNDGTNSSLDGPLWMNPDRFYIADDGTIRAEVPCWPDPDITQDVLGEGNTRVPDDPAEFVRLLTAESANQGRIPLTPQVHADVATQTVTTTPVETASVDSQDTAITDALNLAGLQVSFNGELSAGPLRLGDGTLINLDRGTRITASGTVDDMRARLHGPEPEAGAPIRSFHMAADGTTLRAGTGRVGIDLHYRSDRPLQVQITDFELNDLSVEAPAERGRRHSLRWEQLRVERGAEAVITAESGEGAAPGFRVHLPRVDLTGVQAELHLLGGDGRPAQLTLGARPSSDDAPMSLSSEILIDTASDTFRLVTDVENHQMRLSSVALDSSHFDLRTREATLVGSGRVQIDSSNGTTTFDLRAADPERPIEARVELDDAFIGPRGSQAAFTADLAAGSTSTLRLTHLGLTPGENPVLAGNAELDITLDSLHFPGGEALDLNLREGTRGVLRLHDMGWERGDASPSMRASLEVDLGVSALFDPSSMPGMEGISARVDTETGHTHLVIEGTLHRDGRLDLAGNLRVRGAHIQGTQVRGRITTPPPVEISDARLGAMPRVPLRARREVARVPARWPRPPEVSFVPRQLVDNIHNAEVSASVRLRPSTLGPITRERRIAGISAGVSVTAQVPASELTATLAVQNGTVNASRSSLRLNPPIRIEVGARGGVGSWGVSGSTVVASISGLTLVPDGSGNFRIRPRIDWVDRSRLPSWLPDIELDGPVEELVGELLSERVLGTQTLPANVRGLLSTLQAVVPTLGQPVELDLQGQEPLACQPSPVDAYVDTDRSRVRISNVSLDPRRATRLELGGGQSIEILPGSNLTAVVEGDTYRLQGRARLGPMLLGNSDRRLGLEGGEADINLVVRAPRDGGAPQIDLQVTNLAARDLDLAGFEPGQGMANFTVESLTRGELSFQWREGVAPRLRARIPEGGSPLTLRGYVVLNDGTEVDLSQGSARGLRVDYGDTTDISITGVEARVAGTFQLPALASQDAPSLDVRRATIRGSLHMNGSGVSTDSDIRLSDVDVSIYRLPLDMGPNFDLRFGQIDLEGDFAIESTGRGWAVAAANRPGGRYNARAVVDRFAFETEEPNIRMVAPNSVFQLNLRRLELREDGVGITVDGGEFDGSLQGGWVRLARPEAGSVLETLRLQEGTRIHGSLPRLDVGDRVRVDATIRMEGAVSHGERNLGGNAATGVEHRDAGLQGQTRLAIRTVVDGPNDMGVNIQMDVDADAHWAGSFTIPPVDARLPE